MQYQIKDLLEIMAQLRNPDGGCPWDVEQTFETIAPYTIEEAYEVDEAIRAGDMDSLKDELGDLMFQTVFHSRMAEEAGHFTFDDVVQGISEKMVRRHPHVFADAEERDSEGQTVAWEVQKAQERAEKASKEGRAASVLDGVSVSLPALLRATKLQKRAARVGFDWPETTMVLDKIQEEAGELVEAVKDGTDQAHIHEEFGDLLFVIANLARHLKVNPEESLRAANAKFIRRFNKVESYLADMGKAPEDSDLDEMDALWNKAKEDERKAD